MLWIKEFKLHFIWNGQGGLGGVREQTRMKGVRKSGTVEGKQYCGRLFKSSRLDLDKHWSCSQCFTTIRIAYWFFSVPAFSLDLAYCSFLFLPCHFSLSSSPSSTPHPTHPQLFKYYFSPSCRPLPPFFSLSLSCHCLSVGILSALSVVCVRICEHIETEIHLRAHWFKNTFDIGGPLLQIRSEAYHTHIDIHVEICINQSSTPKFLLKLCDWPS